MKPEYKKYIFIGIAVFILLISGVFVLGRKDTSRNQPEEETPAEEVIPTVNSSVKVDLSAQAGRKEVTLAIEGIPDNTESIDYELSYQTAQQGLQGVIGTISDIENSKYEKKLTLGTCSSGTCVYHQVVGKIKLTLKFNGSYGAKLYEKEFEI